MNNEKMEHNKILVVDDEPIGRQLLQAVLLPENFEVIIAEDGVDALKKMNSFQPDVVLLDVMMPGMDGYETMKEAKKNPAIKDIPVIFITALDDRDSRIRGLESGANDYIAKPFDRIEILTKIKNLIDKTYTKRSQSDIGNGSYQAYNQLNDKIFSNIYSFEEHKNKFPGKLEVSMIGSETNPLVSGWFYNNNKTLIHCFFGSEKPANNSVIGNILISVWLYKLLPDIPLNPSEISSYIDSLIKKSDILPEEDKNWWSIVFVSEDSENWKLAGTNQVLFLPDRPSDNSIKLSSDKVLKIDKGFSYYLFSSDIHIKINESEIINSIHQSTSLNFTHDFLAMKTNLNSSFALKISL